jgi:hypothetical protein
MGSNNFAASGSTDGCLVSIGPNRSRESIVIVGGSESMGSNNLGDSNGVDVSLSKEGEVLFLGTVGRTKEWGIGLRVVSRFSGIEIISPT